jgi:hypothetical protein
MAAVVLFAFFVLHDCGGDSSTPTSPGAPAPTSTPSPSGSSLWLSLSIFVHPVWAGRSGLATHVSLELDGRELPRRALGSLGPTSLFNTVPKPASGRHRIRVRYILQSASSIRYACFADLLLVLPPGTPRQLVLETKTVTLRPGEPIVWQVDS